MSEKWIKVTSEAELRPGMVVKLERCLLCGGSHVMMLLALACPAPGQCPLDPKCKEGWRSTMGGCRFGGSDYRCFKHRSIPDGRLFRLDTGLDDQAERRAGQRIYSRPKERAR